MRLNEISDKPGARTARTRVGRGIGSGKGRTAGRGMKGQKSRSGVALKGFEGGQMPIHRRLPKRGFRNINGKRFAEVSLATLQTAIDKKKLDTSKPVTEALLKEAGIVTHLRDGVRVLGNGELKARIDLVVTGATRSAVAAVEAAGGSIEVTRPPAARPEGQAGAAETPGDGSAGGGGAEGEEGADADRDESGS